MPKSNKEKTMFNNQSGLEFTDISSESYRTYTFAAGKVTISNPTHLNVSTSGGHRLFDGQGKSHYVPAGWLHLEWEPKDGAPNFVK